MGKSYGINEIFYSLQFEGARYGSANIFIRFKDCNLACSYCDTEFESGRDMSVDEIIDEAKKYKTKNIILTGGEPALQVDSDLISRLHAEGYFIAIETNGSLPVPNNIDWITCSPKVAEHVVKKSFPNGVSELKYVRSKGQEIPQPAVESVHKFLSPAFFGNEPSADNLRYCIALVLAHPTWKLTLQGHKLLNVR